MAKIIRSVSELKELIEQMRRDLEKDGHPDTTTAWIIEVILDHPQYHDAKEVVAQLAAEQLLK